MNDAINAYISNSFFLLSFLGLSFVITPICTLTAINCLDPIYEPKNGKAELLQKVGGSLCAIIAFFSAMFCFGTMLSSCSGSSSISSDLTKIKNCIASEYKVQLIDGENNSHNLKQMIDIQTENSQLSLNYQDSIQIGSLNSANSTTYNVFVVKQNDTWQLCKRNDQGEYIPLNPAHTIQDLKEN